MRNATLLMDDSGVLEVGPLSEMFDVLSRTLYIGPFRNVLDVEGKNRYFDLSIGRDFVQKWSTLQLGDDPDSRRRIVRLCEQIQDIFGFTKLDISPSDDKSTLIVAQSNGRTFKLGDTGAGLTQFIVTLASAAFQSPSIVLIDEPELNLHPQLQLAFLTHLGRHASHGVIFATHSIGLARAASNTAYVLRAKADEPPVLRRLDSVPRLSEFLGELSFGGYQELGFQKVLLVEGINEIKTVQQWLRQRGKDREVVILPLGGSAFINGTREDELVELTRISPAISALIDSERSAQGAEIEPARSAFAEVCKRLSIVCHVLDRRATENYFTAAAARVGVGEWALQPYEALSGQWGKVDGWRIAGRMNRSDLDGTDLGEFLDRL